MRSNMARRQIGQERLAVGCDPVGRDTSLDDVSKLVEWAELDRLLAGISASSKGEPGWPPLALFRALLLATWYDLSDVRLAESLDDRASFRRFCGFNHDDEARWAGHRRRKPVHGYKAHVATDQDAGLIRGVEITTANVHDAAELDAILPDAPGDTYGDTAYSGSRPEAVIRARGGNPRVVHAGTWGGGDALARLQEHNAEVRRVRARIEKVFGTCKRCYGLRRMRWLGLAKAGLQVRLTAMAYNLRRSWRLLAVATA
jgi:transposase, IS5 family